MPLRVAFFTTFGSNFITIVLVNTMAMQTTSRIHGINGHIFKLVKYFWVCLRLQMHAANGGYIPPDVLIRKVLPYIKRSENMEVLCFGLGFMTRAIALLLGATFDLFSFQRLLLKHCALYMGSMDCLLLCLCNRFCKIIVLPLCQCMFGRK